MVDWVHVLMGSCGQLVKSGHRGQKGASGTSRVPVFCGNGHHVITRKKR